MGALLLGIRAQFPNPFYMLVPSVFFMVFLAAAVMIAVELLRGRWVAVAAVGSLLVAAVLLGNAHDDYGVYRFIPAESANFRASLPVIAQRLPQKTPGQVFLVVDDFNYESYKFVGSPLGRDLEQYIYGSKTDLDARFLNMHRSEFDRTGPSTMGSYVVFDGAMRVVKIVVVGKTTYTRPGPDLPVPG